MNKDVLIPQGTYLTGRDVPAGVYVIEALNECSRVEIESREQPSKYESYDLGGDDSTQCHIELFMGEALTIQGKVKIRRVGSFPHADGRTLTPTAQKNEDNKRASHVPQEPMVDFETTLINYYGDDYSRLERARRYVREGRVLELCLARGSITARVKGSGKIPYTVEIKIDKCRNSSENRIPSKKQISFQCNCPDSASPCKHSLAVLSAFSVDMSTNPYILDYIRDKKIEI